MLRRLAIVALALIAAASLAAGIATGGSREPANARGAKVLALTVDSAAVGRRLALRIVVPPGGGRGLLVFLHGRGVSVDHYLDDPFFQALAALGDRAPVVALPSGGGGSYWHDRSDGDWGRYVVKEVIPRVLERSGADSKRVAIGGISMGGFGALDLFRLYPKRFCAAGAHSPALWRTSGETAPGAFDGAADFSRHDVVGAARRLRGRNLWLDAGETDPFRPGARAFAAGARVKLRTYGGGHDDGYWNRHWDEYLRFYARQLARCGS